MSNTYRRILFSGLLAVFAGLIITAILYYATRPRTLMAAISRGNVQAVRSFLHEDGLEAGPSAPLYLKQAIWYYSSALPRERDISERRREHLKQISCEMVKLLVQYGAEINQPSRPNGNTPLMDALLMGNIKVAHYLIEQGALVNVVNNDYETPLMYALLFDGNIEIVELLFDHHAKETINYVDISGNSALHRTYDAAIVQLLLENGADPNIINLDGDTPWSLAQRYNIKEIISVLEKYMKTNGENGVDSDTLSGMQNDW